MPGFLEALRMMNMFGNEGPLPTNPAGYTPPVGMQPYNPPPMQPMQMPPVGPPSMFQGGIEMPQQAPYSLGGSPDVNLPFTPNTAPTPQIPNPYFSNTGTGAPSPPVGGIAPSPTAMPSGVGLPAPGSMAEGPQMMPEPMLPFTSGMQQGVAPPELPASPLGLNQPTEQDIFSKMYQPEHQVSDAYAQLMGQYPTEAPHGKLQRIAAALATFGAGAGPAGWHGGSPYGIKMNPQMGLAAGNEVMHGQQNRDIADWTGRLKAMEPGMVSERQSNISARTAANESAKRYIDERKVAETERKNLETEATNRKKVEIQEAGQNLRRLMYDNPELEMQAPKGGNYIMFNPRTGKSMDTGVKTGTLSPTDEAEMKYTNAKKLQDNKAGIDKANDTGSEIPTEIGGVSYTINTKTAKLTPVTLPDGTPAGHMTRVSGQGNTAKPLTPAQQKVAIANRATEFKARFPQYSDYITIEPGNNVVIQPPKASTMGFGGNDLTPEMYRTIVNEIHGVEEPVAPPPNTNNAPSSPAPAGSNQTGAGTGEMVRMTDPQGRPLRVPASEVNRLMKLGAKKVQ